MIEMRLSEVATNFGDRALIGAADATTRRRGLKIVGQDLRRNIRRSIKGARAGPDGRYPQSNPGGPPFYRVKKGTPKGRNKFVGSAGIVYEYSAATQSVVVGARKLATRQSPPMPMVLEGGGVRESDIRSHTRIRHRKVGSGGEIRLGSRGIDGTTKSAGIDIDTPVAYTKLRTAKQAERSQRINIFLYASSPASVPRNFIVRSRIRARPYVEPQWRSYRESGNVSRVFAKIMAAERPLRGKMKKVRT